jgi:hypothetical protein
MALPSAMATLAKPAARMVDAASVVSLDIVIPPLDV